MKSTKQGIRQALLELLAQRPFAEIQVKDLVAQAGIARATFYLHFKSRDELLLDYIDEMFEGFFAEIEEALAHADLLDEGAAERMFATFSGEKAFSRVLTQDSVQAILQSRFRSYLARIVGRVVRENRGFNLSPEQLAYLIEFWAGGSFLLLKTWVERDFQPPEAEMAQLYAKLTLSSIRALMD
ncbi:MAG: TetR/AcrR family transcriptional regulator [Marinobacter sp.]|uniref:TetR/AcrR family transcriptional regulator n=1 Tax=Marinobacter sp. TaxID=50741 RepID=UPI00299DBD3C|nr:TetR/AcrR family transcriptional regulator [Marinobacter sp.]MDX1757068.1 TetR/AcrR family transcriptional regulator [Marinobacter sp.]